MYYIMGIDGSKTPDPRYWADRWEIVVAENEEIAKDLYIAQYINWLRPDEYPYVKALKSSEEEIGHWGLTKFKREML